jgi:lysophospholipase L1-like esterase
MKTILAYGDSLTFGANPAGGRHPFEDRWPTALEMALAGEARVIAEGLSGRTTAFDDWLTNADRNGARILPTLLASHAPLDLIIIMLGTNDLKPAVCGSASEAARGMRRLIQVIKGHFAGEGQPRPKMLIVAPPHIVDTDNVPLRTHFGGIEHAKAQSHEFAQHYRQLAEEMNVAFFDASTVAKADPLDGVHLDAENTRAIGDALAPLAKELLGL